jgi:hypothetical protein
MKCLLCPNEIDDKREFPKVYDERIRAWDYREAEIRAHTSQQNRWQQIEVVLGPCGEVSIMRGHICPDCANAETLCHLTVARAEGPQREFDPYEKRVIAFMTRTDNPIANNVVVVSQPNVHASNPRPDSGVLGLEIRERADAIALATAGVP